MEVDKSRCHGSRDSAIPFGASMAGSSGARETSIAMTTIALAVLVIFSAMAGGNALAQNVPQSPSATGNWIISETTSPVDYTPVVVAITRSRDSVEGSAMELSISCRNGRTNLVVTGQTISGRGDDYAISYSIDGDKPVQVGAGSPSFGTGAAFQGDIVRLLQSFPEEGEIAVRLVPRTGSAREGSFSLSGLRAVRNKLAAACKWPQAITKPRN
jgi:hypothetical protein